MKKKQSVDDYKRCKSNFKSICKIQHYGVNTVYYFFVCTGYPQNAIFNQPLSHQFIRLLTIPLVYVYFVSQSSAIIHTSCSRHQLVTITNVERGRYLIRKVLVQICLSLPSSNGIKRSTMKCFLFCRAATLKLKNKFRK